MVTAARVAAVHANLDKTEQARALLSDKTSLRVGARAPLRSAERPLHAGVHPLSWLARASRAARPAPTGHGLRRLEFARVQRHMDLPLGLLVQVNLLWLMLANSRLSALVCSALASDGVRGALLLLPSPATEA
jgi:hypothetical protein